MKTLITGTILAISLMTSANAGQIDRNGLKVVSATDFNMNNMTWRYKPKANTCVLEEEPEIYATFFKQRCTVYTHPTLKTGYIAECKTPENIVKPIQIRVNAQNRLDCLYTGKTAKFALKVNDNKQLDNVYLSGI